MTLPTERVNEHFVEVLRMGDSKVLEREDNVRFILSPHGDYPHRWRIRVFDPSNHYEQEIAGFKTRPTMRPHGNGIEYGKRPDGLEIIGYPTK